VYKHQTILADGSTENHRRTNMCRAQTQYPPTGCNWSHLVMVMILANLSLLQSATSYNQCYYITAEMWAWWQF